MDVSGLEELCHLSIPAMVDIGGGWLHRCGVCVAVWSGTQEIRRFGSWWQRGTLASSLLPRERVGESSLAVRGTENQAAHYFGKDIGQEPVEIDRFVEKNAVTWLQERFCRCLWPKWQILLLRGSVASSTTRLFSAILCLNLQVTISRYVVGVDRELRGC